MQIKNFFISIILFMLTSCNTYTDTPVEGSYCIKPCEIRRNQCYDICRNVSNCEKSPIGMNHYEVYDCHDRLNYCDHLYHGRYYHEQCFTGPYQHCYDILIKGYDTCDWKHCTADCSWKYKVCAAKCYD